MRVTFLGTSAANAFPEAFCSCANCEQARALGGPSLRKRSAALVNDDLLVDLGPDVMAASQVHSCPLTRVRYCLQTHGHADHLDTSHFLSRSPAYGTVGAPRLHFYASRETLEWTARLLERDFEPRCFLKGEAGEELNLEIHEVRPLQRLDIGAYQVVAFPANHDPGMGSLVYAIGLGGRWVVYGTDTAALSEDVWRAFHDNELRFDVVILDHTYGPQEVGSDHLSARDVIAHAMRMRAEGLLADGARVLGTHIAHEGNPAHPELAAFAAEHDYEIAYDGLVVGIG
jgi:phosphoribosyl 1,2-cyclic phosphate phosphodiesterase